MASCGDLEAALRDMRRRIAALEQCTGCGGGTRSGGGGTPNNLDEERIVKKAVERVYKDRRWLAALDLFNVIFRGTA